MKPFARGRKLPAVTSPRPVSILPEGNRRPQAEIDARRPRGNNPRALPPVRAVTGVHPPSIPHPVMQFFKRILQPPDSAVAPEKRKSGQRLVISPEFPLRCGLGLSGAKTGGDRDVWNWKCRLLNCSEAGLRLQLGAAVAAVAGEPCDLKLDLEGFELVVPCRISNHRRQGERTFLGLRHAIADEETQHAYRQFLEIVALGATLRLQLRSSQADAGEYLVEQYASERRSCLNVWRHPSTRQVAAAEFILKDCLVRVVGGGKLEYYAGPQAVAAMRAAPEQSLEIHRLFRWVACNLSLSVPEDLRKFLQQRSA
jgi:hypothetical protein